MYTSLFVQTTHIYWVPAVFQAVLLPSKSGILKKEKFTLERTAAFSGCVLAFYKPSPSTGQMGSQFLVLADGESLFHASELGGSSRNYCPSNACKGGQSILVTFTSFQPKGWLTVEESGGFEKEKFLLWNRAACLSREGKWAPGLSLGRISEASHSDWDNPTSPGSFHTLGPCLCMCPLVLLLAFQVKEFKQRTDIWKDSKSLLVKCFLFDYWSVNTISFYSESQWQQRFIFLQPQQRGAVGWGKLLTVRNIYLESMWIQTWEGDSESESLSDDTLCRVLGVNWLSFSQVVSLHGEEHKERCRGGGRLVPPHTFLPPCLTLPAPLWHDSHHNQQVLARSSKGPRGKLCSQVFLSHSTWHHNLLLSHLLMWVPGSVRVSVKRSPE